MDKKRILVLADTHLNVPASKRAVDKAGPCDLVIHLGDCYKDIEELYALTKLPFLAVAGNKDWHAPVPPEDFWEIAGVTVMATHGHLDDLSAYSLAECKQEQYGNMVKRAKARGARLILFGHTHRAETFYHEDILFCNPGEMTYGSYRLSYGILELSLEAEIKFSIEYLEDNPHP